MIIILGQNCSCLSLVTTITKAGIWLLDNNKNCMFSQVNGYTFRGITCMVSVYMCFLELDSEWHDVPFELLPLQNPFNNKMFAIWSQELDTYLCRYTYDVYIFIVCCQHFLFLSYYSGFVNSVQQITRKLINHHKVMCIM